MHEQGGVLSQPSGNVKVLVADRNLMSAQLLAYALGQNPRFRVVVVSSASQLMLASVSANADVAVVSPDLGGTKDDTMRTARTFNQKYPSVRLVMILETSSPDVIVDAFRSGASGVFARTQPVTEFLKCVERVSQGEISASRDEIDHLLAALRGTLRSHMIGCEEIDVLSQRELQVVRHAGEGSSNKEIAEKLGLSEHTVKNYLFRACEKIGVSSRVELFFYLFRQDKRFSEKADDGLMGTEFMLDLISHAGSGSKKNGQAAYYRLRLAESNAERLLERTSSMIEVMRQTMTADEIRNVERKIARNSRVQSPPQALFDSTQDHLNARSPLVV